MADKDRIFVLKHNELQRLFDVLVDRGYTLVGPKLGDGAIVLGELRQVSDLPQGWSEVQDAGTYRLKRRNDQALFGFNNGPHSFKKYLFPPRSKLWQGEKNNEGRIRVIEAPDTSKPFAFIGVRPCDLEAIQVQDRVFMEHKYPDPLYSQRRTKALVIAINCSQAAKTCFCTSMNTGPRARAGYDLALTEVLDGDQHYFTVEVGSERGEAIWAEVPHGHANEKQIESSLACSRKAQQEMGRKIDISDIKELLYNNYDNTRWDELEKRCLTCGNCTMACPTCFCSKVEDVTDLTGEHAERWREWDSCFTMDFSYIHGGNVRSSARSRYRHWLVHKLATWLDQFGTSGCVGCGRCITWCPVGIDLTEEIQLLRQAEHKEDIDHG